MEGAAFGGRAAFEGTVEIASVTRPQALDGGVCAAWERPSGGWRVRPSPHILPRRGCPLRSWHLLYPHLTPRAEQPAVPRREPHSGMDPGAPPDHPGVCVTLLPALSFPLFFHFSLVFLCLLSLISFLKSRFSLPSQAPMASTPGPFRGLGSPWT